MTKLYNRKAYTQLRKKLRSEMTKGERMLWSRLRGSQIGYKFRRQYGVGKYVVDFYATSVRVAIEIDGLSHEENYERDVDRQQYIESVGIQVIRFHSQEIVINLDSVVQSIYEVCVNRNITS